MGWQDKHKVIPAAYVILQDRNKILLLRRFNTGYMDGSYSLPSGHVDGGEPADAAACREANEEVGVEIAPEDLRLVHTLHRLAEEGDHERICLFFTADKWSGEAQNMEPDKCDETTWFEIDNMPENMAPEVAHALKEIKNNKLYSSMNFEVS